MFLGSDFCAAVVIVAVVPYNGTEPTPYGNDTCLVACATSGCASVPQVQLFDVLADEAVSNHLH